MFVVKATPFAGFGTKTKSNSKNNRLWHVCDLWSRKVTTTKKNVFFSLAHSVLMLMKMKKYFNGKKRRRKCYRKLRSFKGEDEKNVLIIMRAKWEKKIEKSEFYTFTLKLFSLSLSRKFIVSRFSQTCLEVKVTS